jgi:hypothetical protein
MLLGAKKTAGKKMPEGGHRRYLGAGSYCLLAQPFQDHNTAFGLDVLGVSLA